MPALSNLAWVYRWAIFYGTGFSLALDADHELLSAPKNASLSFLLDYIAYSWIYSAAQPTKYGTAVQRAYNMQQSFIGEQRLQRKDARRQHIHLSPLDS